VGACERGDRQTVYFTNSYADDAQSNVRVVRLLIMVTVIPTMMMFNVIAMASTRWTDIMTCS